MEIKCKLLTAVRLCLAFALFSDSPLYISWLWSHLSSFCFSQHGAHFHWDFTFPIPSARTISYTLTCLTFKIFSHLSSNIVCSEMRSLITSPKVAIPLADSKYPPTLLDSFRVTITCKLPSSSCTSQPCSSTTGKYTFCDRRTLAMSLTTLLPSCKDETGT